MILRLASFGPFTTAFLPAAGLWTSMSGVTIIPGGGRSGSADDNCAAFSTALGSVLSLDVSPGINGGVYTATYGLAVRVLTITDFFTISTIFTPFSSFDLQILSDGSVRLTQTSGGVLQGTICETAAGVVPITTGGCYLEVQILFEAGVATACQILASDQYGDMNAVAQGAVIVLSALDLPYTGFRLGGGSAEAAATWRVADVYLNDGIPAATALAYKGRLIYNDSFFGNTHVESLYATADGANQAVANTPWVPNSGSAPYNRINEHPPDEDVTYDSADENDQTSTFLYDYPGTTPFGMLNCSAVAAIYGVQWDGRLRSEDPLSTDSEAVASIIRRIVTGTFGSDVVAEGHPLLIEDNAYRYYPDVFDRNPTNSNLPFTFAAFRPAGVGVPGTTEFGVRLL